MASFDEAVLWVHESQREFMKKIAVTSELLTIYNHDT